MATKVNYLSFKSLEPRLSRPSQTGRRKSSNNSIVSKIRKSSLWFSIPCSGIAEPLEGSLGGPVSSWRPVRFHRGPALSTHTWPASATPSCRCVLCLPPLLRFPATAASVPPLFPAADVGNLTQHCPVPRGIREKTFAEVALRFHNAAAV